MHWGFPDRAAPIGAEARNPTPSGGVGAAAAPSWSAGLAYDERTLQAARAQRRFGIREIPLDAICGTVEPSRAKLFDDCFRPAASVRRRWERLWVAEQRGTVLPPISVVPIGEMYAIRDGHHRVSVAKARGAMTIDASVDRV